MYAVRIMLLHTNKHMKYRILFISKPRQPVWISVNSPAFILHDSCSFNQYAVCHWFSLASDPIIGTTQKVYGVAAIPEDEDPERAHLVIITEVGLMDALQLYQTEEVCGFRI